MGDCRFPQKFVPEQFDEQEAWYDGKISRVNQLPGGSFRYDVEYDDGDFEDDMLPENVRPVERSADEVENDRLEKEAGMELKHKQSKARNKARYVHFAA